MKILSLFDGISCGRLALDRADINVRKYYASEVDKYAIKVAQENYPDTVQLGDITDWKSWQIDSPDIIIGGFPCQGFSSAGKQLNFEDPRSKLFFVLVDILRHYKPKYFLFENVKMKKESQDIISECLGVQPIEINSSLVSGQNRLRLYWTNIPNVTQPTDNASCLCDVVEEGVSSEYYFTAQGYITMRNILNRSELKNLGYRNTIIPSPYNVKVPCIDANYYKGYDGKRAVIEDLHGKLRRLTVVECERLQTLPDNYTYGISNTQRYKAIGNGWTVDVIAHILRHIK